MNSKIGNDFGYIIMEKSFFAFITFVTATGFLFIYGWVCQQLGEDTIVEELWQPLYVIATMTNVAVVVLTIVSEIYNYTKRNLLTEGSMDNPELLYLMCLPLIIIAVTFMTLGMIKNISVYNCMGKDYFMLNFTTITYLVALMILLINSNAIYDPGEVWKLNIINMATILMAIFSLIVFIIYYISIEQTNIFINMLNNTFIHTGCDHTNSSIIDIFTNLYTSFYDYYPKLMILSGISCSVFLLKPFSRHYNHLVQYKLKIRQRNPNYVENYNLSISLKCKGFCIVIGVISIIMILYMIVKKDYLSVSLCSSIEIFIYVIMIFFNLTQWRIMKDWDCQYTKKFIFNEVLVWIGLFGQLLHTFSIIAMFVYELKYKSENGLTFLILILFKSALQIFQNTLQSITESTLLEKTWKRPQEENFSISVTGFLFMAVGNMVFFCIDFALLSEPALSMHSESLSLKLFATLVYRSGIMLGVLQRAHGCILFSSYVVFIIRDHNYLQEIIFIFMTLISHIYL